LISAKSARPLNEEQGGQRRQVHGEPLRNSISTADDQSEPRIDSSSRCSRARTNSWIAPHNMEGLFLNMGDMLVKSGDWRLAQKVYGLARGVRGVGDYASWPYRDVLEADFGCRAERDGVSQ
jgi:hypothetical protein